MLKPRLIVTVRFISLPSHTPPTLSRLALASPFLFLFQRQVWSHKLPLAWPRHIRYFSPGTKITHVACNIYSARIILRKWLAIYNQLGFRLIWLNRRLLINDTLTYLQEKKKRLAILQDLSEASDLVRMSRKTKWKNAPTSSESYANSSWISEKALRKATVSLATLAIKNGLNSGKSRKTTTNNFRTLNAFLLTGYRQTAHLGASK